MHSHVAVSASEERISLREWKCEIPSLQQYVLLHRPEQPSITYLTLALSFSMRLKCILKIHQLSKNLVFVLALRLCLRDSLLLFRPCRKGVSWGCWLADRSVVICGEVLGSQWLGVSWRMVSESVASWSLKWMQSELDGLVNLTFGHETLRKENKWKEKNKLM